MRVYGMTEAQVKETVDTVSADLYAGNLYAANAREVGVRRIDTTFVLRVHSSRGAGARLAPSGRRTVAATWQAHADVIRALFVAGALRVKSAVADYADLDHFEETHRATRWHQVGSDINPVSLGDL